MPFILQKPCICGFKGGFGGVACVGKIWHFWHGVNADGTGETPCQGFYETPDGKSYPTLKAAWYTIRAKVPGPEIWKRAHDARIEGKDRLANKLFKRWNDGEDN